MRQSLPALPLLAVSACLVGCRCRYDGRTKRSAVVLALAQHFALVPFCPELEAGLGVPRPAMRFRTRPGGVRLLTDENLDVTERMREASDRLVAAMLAAGIKAAICKERSPSCGVRLTHLDSGLAPLPGLFSGLASSSGLLLFTEEDAAAESFVHTLAHALTSRLI
jgi:uncharacterized protein YbbK (DUF523 family)